MRVEGDGVAVPASVSAAVDETVVAAVTDAQSEHAIDLFGEVPAGGHDGQARSAVAGAAEHEAAMEAVEALAQSSQQGSFDGFDLPAEAATVEGQAAPVAVPASSTASSTASDALAQAIANTDAVAEAMAHEAEPAVDVTEVVAAVQEAVAGLAAADVVAASGASAPDASAPDATATQAKAGAGKRGGGRRAESGAAKRKAAPAVAVDANAATPAPVTEAIRKPASAVNPSPSLAAEAAPTPAEAAPVIDLDAQLNPLSDRLRMLQLETVDLRRAADREMRRVNRLLLALAAVVLIAIVALGLQTTALSSAHRDADALQRRVDRLTSSQETQQANLAAMQQRADELGVQVQRLTNRSAVALRPQPARRERRPR
ncbi:hypothetical protein AB4851_05960 [Burkholderia sp. 22PA0099]|uniref:hypothetical protein n=1 Tax=Burkholderia sp. 22PA0099 TaxID=3237372 RepID=UPI0039C234D2